MTTSTLPSEFVPLRDGFTVDLSYPTIETQLEGGLLRKQQYIQHKPHLVTINWSFSSAQYTRFMGFFRTTLQEATYAFLMNIITDISESTLHKCRSKNGMPKLTQQRGLMYAVSCLLEVEENPTYTGVISYVSPNQIVFSASPFIVGAFKATDQVKVLNTAGTHPGGVALNFDGTYTIASTSGTNTLTLSSPSGVSASWTTLGALSPTNYGVASNIVSTITRVPT